MVTVINYKNLVHAIIYTSRVHNSSEKTKIPSLETCQTGLRATTCRRRSPSVRVRGVCADRPAISFHASEGEAQFHRHVMHEHVLNEDIFVFSGESMSQIFEANNSNHLISRIIESSVFIMAYILQILLLAVF